MNRKLALTLVAAALAAGNAFADDIALEASAFTSPSSFVSTKTRAEVRAELAEHLRANPFGLPYEHEASAPFNESLTRDQVKAELAEYRRVNPWGLPDEWVGDLGQDTARVAGQPVNAQ